MDTPPADLEPTPPLWRRLLPGLGKAAGTLALAMIAMQAIGWLRAPSLPEQAPDFTLRDLDGQSVQLRALRGQPVLLNFWATWCGPCRIEAPAVSRFADRHPDVVVLGVVADGPPPKVRKVAQDLGITYRVVMGDRATLASYDVSLFPTTVLVDAEGHIQAAHAGLMLDPQLELLPLMP